MEPKEIEAVRAFCVYLRAAGMGEGWLANMTDEQVRTMVAVGDTIEKMGRGMTAAAIATPSGPVLVEALKGGGFLVKRSHRSDRCEGKDLAVVLYDALVAAGGPLLDEPATADGYDDGYRQALLDVTVQMCEVDIGGMADPIAELWEKAGLGPIPGLALDQIVALGGRELADVPTLAGGPDEPA